MKEVEGYIEKDRAFRDRSKKKRLTVDEKRELTHASDLKPKHEPYHRKKDWMQLPAIEYDSPEEDNSTVECPIHQKLYEDDGFGCPYCGEEDWYTEQEGRIGSDADFFDREVYDADYKEVPR